MGRKKDIGEVFQDKLKDFKESPSEGIWDAIAAEIDQSPRRRIVPFWYYFGASALVTALVVGLIFWQPWSEVSKTNKITSTEDLDKSSTKKNKQKESQDLLVITNEEGTITSNESNKDSNTSLKNNAQLKEDTTEETEIYRKTSSVATGSSQTVKQTTAVKRPFETKENTILSEIKRQLSIRKKAKELNEIRARKVYKAKIALELEEAIAVQKAENKKYLEEQQKRDAALALTKKNKQLEEKQKDQLATNEQKVVKEERIPKSDEQRSLDRKEATEYNFAISPFTSLLSYGSLARASSIDDRLVNNPRESISTVGYGLRVDYRLNEKTSLRFGVGVAPLKYRTDNFQVSSVNGNINIFQLSGINTQNLNQPGIETSPEAQAFFQQNQIVSIEQDISYIEVPVDLQYRFLNKRIALSLNTGLSLFVLTDNSVFATAESGQSILIGRETDLKDLSLAFNLGLGTHYNISKRWRFDAEPAFKYQLNPYTNSNSNFRPYYFGMQFGLSYKF